MKTHKSSDYKLSAVGVLNVQRCKIKMLIKLIYYINILYIPNYVCSKHYNRSNLRIFI